MFEILTGALTVLAATIPFYCTSFCTRENLAQDLHYHFDSD